MLDSIRGAYLADARRRDLLREARMARLAADVASPVRGDGTGDRALLLVADTLASVSERLRAHLQLRRLARLHAALADDRCACPASQCLASSPAR